MFPQALCFCDCHSLLSVGPGATGRLVGLFADWKREAQTALPLFVYQLIS